MLSLNPASLTSGENGHSTATPSATVADANYAPYDLTGDGLQGRWRHQGCSRAGGYRARTGGAEVQACHRPNQNGGRFNYQAGTGGLACSERPAERRTIGHRRSGFGNLIGNYHRTAFERNGASRRRITAVTPGQTLSVAQLNGLMFTPAADASGKIAILRYCAGAPEPVIGGVLLVVGPDAPPLQMPPVVAVTVVTSLRRLLSRCCWMQLSRRLRQRPRCQQIATMRPPLRRRRCRTASTQV